MDVRGLVDIAWEHDPAFVEFASRAFGATSSEDVYKSVYKSSPDPADVGTPSRLRRNQKGSLRATKVFAKAAPAGGAPVTPLVARKRTRPIPSRTAAQPLAAANGQAQAAQPKAKTTNKQPKSAVKPAKTMKAPAPVAKPMKAPTSKKAPTSSRKQAPTAPVPTRARLAGVAKGDYVDGLMGRPLKPGGDKSIHAGGKYGNGVLIAGTGVLAGLAAKRMMEERYKRKMRSDRNMYSYSKSASGGFDMEFAKTDDEKKLVFGWASITDRDGQPVADRQGDIIALEEVEKSAYQYVVKSRTGGRQHRRNEEDGTPFHASDLVESLVVTPEKREAMGLPDSVPNGWWVGFKVRDDDTWDAVKKGDVTGFSIHGRGKRLPYVPQ